jgi:Zn-dependent peptidase ImmA (M78 family)/transcriptional regulator with XRE-family HTH domain
MPQADLAGQLETVRALFDGGRLAQARHFAGLLKTELADETGLSAAAIGQFESGAARPTTGTVAKLALALAVPPTFFSGNRKRVSIAEADTHFRSLRSTSKRDRAKARAQVELLAEIMATLERRVRLPAVDLPELDPASTPEEAAQAARQAWDLGDGPIPDVVGLFERKGIIVSRLPAATDELDAFSCWAGARPFIILVSNKEAADRARFDAAHELAHILLHHDAQPGDSSVERAAHMFAAEFLAPTTSIRPLLPRRVDWRRLAELKLEWGLSMAMLVRRMRDLGLISDAAYRRGMMDLSRRGWRRSEPINLGEPERPELLAHVMALLEEHRGFSLDQLGEELALNRENISPFIETLSGGRLTPSI